MRVLPASLALCLSVALLGGPGVAARSATQAEQVGGSRIVGDRIRNPIELTDLQGRTHTLFPRRKVDRRVVVLVFWSLRDPISRRYVEQLGTLRADHARDPVDVYLVNSNHDEITSAWADPLERLRGFARDEELEIPMLIDPGNALADRFAAMSNNHAFVIDRGLIVRYAGGIDDDARGKRRARGQDVHPWLRDALEAVLKGVDPEQPLTRPAGRPIKRAPKEAEKDC